MQEAGCIFCRIARKELPALIVYQDELCIAFLDVKPLFYGHTLLVPKQHFVTLAELSGEIRDHLFARAQLLSIAVQQAMGAEGTFVAMNNIVSQSVPHFHIHVVPRKKGDGLRGFFWPRTHYTSEIEQGETAEAIARALEGK